MPAQGTFILAKMSHRQSGQNQGLRCPVGVGVGFRQLRTRRRTRPEQLCANRATLRLFNYFVSLGE